MKDFASSPVPRFAIRVLDVILFPSSMESNLRIHHRLTCGLASVLGALLAVIAGAAPATVDFNRDIRPLLADHCYQCHGPDAAKRKAGLRLDQREGALAKLESGEVAIAPGNPDASKLLKLVATHDDDRMPPAKTGKRLGPDQIALLTRWIGEGAEWKPHWSYITPERPAVPA
ncbi:MAG: hypothetical protein RIS76_4419, partial [Verrucomicrobiota bacterium]